MSMLFKCRECGAEYPERTSFCSFCWSSGQVILCPHRPRAQIDSQAAHTTADQILRRNVIFVPQTAYPELEAGIHSFVLLSGEPASGKSTCAANLLNSVPGEVLLVSSEEGISSSTLASRLRRVDVKRRDFHVVSAASVDYVANFARAHNITALAVDSLSESSYTAHECRHLIDVLPKLDLFVGVLQITKSGLPAGAMALQHLCDVHLHLDRMKWTTVKNRYGAVGITGDVLPQRRGSDETPTGTVEPMPENHRRDTVEEVN